MLRQPRRVVVIQSNKQNIKKMYKLDVEPILCQIIVLYRRLGIWRDDGESEFRKSCMRILHFLQFLSYFIFNLTAAYQAYQSGHINELIYYSELEICFAVLAIKLAYLLWRKNEILTFLYDPIVNHCTEDYGESMIAKQKFKKFTVFNKLYSVILSSTLVIVILVALPIFTDDKKMLPLFIRFNLESDHDTVLYWMAYISGSVNVFLSCVFSTLMLFVWNIMYNYSIEYKLLGHRFKSLGVVTPNTYYEELIQLIRSHNNLFE